MYNHSKQVVIFLFTFIFLLQGCYQMPARDIYGNTTSRPGPNLGLHSKKKKKELTAPPSEFTNGIFNYREKMMDWPMSLDAVKIIPGFTEGYNKLMDNGVYEMKFIKMTPDSLIINFFYSNTIHSRSKGYKENFILDGIQGTYIFYYNKNVRLFTMKNIR
ncbi:MAG: hypothetical protein JWN76_3741 [Chitinophagaceae bacterium]|nr:hypothetical protein [Chitinophagaceae bacterium]